MPLLQTIGNATARAWRRYGPTTAAADYELISTTVLGSSAASVTFSGLGTSAAAYKHLQIRYTAKSVSSMFDVTMQINGDSGSNYAWHILYGNGSSALSAAGTSQTSARVGNAMQSDVSNGFATSIVDILDFSNTSKNKTVRSLYGNVGSAGNTYVGLWSAAWLSTSAVTSLVFGSSSAFNFVTGSRFSLYGLK